MVSRFSQRYEAARLFSTLIIIRNVSRAANQHRLERRSLLRGPACCNNRTEGYLFYSEVLCTLYCLKCNRQEEPQTMGTDLEWCRIASLAPHWKWMGAVRMRVQTADKNITIIHTTAVHRLTSCEVKSCVFVRNKCIIKMFLILNNVSS